MNTITIIIMTVLGQVCSRSITHKRFSSQKSVRLYSRVGRHVTINASGVIGSTFDNNNQLSNLKFIPTAAGEFIIQSEATGLYVNAKQMRKQKSYRLRAVSNRAMATHFNEEVKENKFNKYNLKGKSKCTLIMRNNGKLRVQCQKSNSVLFRAGEDEFLPRRVHRH